MNTLTTKQPSSDSSGESTKRSKLPEARVNLGEITAEDYARKHEWPRSITVTLNGQPTKIGMRYGYSFKNENQVYGQNSVLPTNLEQK